MALTDLFTSLFPTTYADEEEKPKEEAEDSGGEAEEEEEEPEDIAPAIREECKESAACAGFEKHFQHCAEKIANGDGYKGEDCVEELFHVMHCVDNCAAPKVFSKLR